MVTQSTKMMKILNFLLIVSYGCCGKDIHDIDEELPGYSLQGIEREFTEQDKDIHRPCPFYDLLCICRYLAKHSKCKIAQGPVPDPLFRTQANVYIPGQNLSLVVNDIYFRGLTGSVTEFYVNRKNELTILSVELRNFSINTTNIIFRYFRRGQEPVITNSTSYTTTTVFRGIKDLSLSNSESTAFLSILPVINVDPSAGVDDTDPTIAARFATFAANMQMVVQEASLTQAPFYAANYKTKQNVLCDFGLKIE